MITIFYVVSTIMKHFLFGNGDRLSFVVSLLVLIAAAVAYFPSSCKKYQAYYAPENCKEFTEEFLVGTMDH